MSKLERLRIWICVNFLGIFVWPSVKMDFVHIVKYPLDPYGIAKLLEVSPWDYWREAEYAMWREDALRLDALGFVSEPTEKRRSLFKAGVILMDAQPLIWKANRRP